MWHQIWNNESLLIIKFIIKIELFDEETNKAARKQLEEYEELLSDLGSIPEDIRGAVRNNGGGHDTNLFIAEWVN